MKNKKKLIVTILIIIGAACLVTAVVLLVQLNQKGNVYDEVKKEAYSKSKTVSSEPTVTSAPATATPTPTPTPTETAAPTEKATPTPTPTEEAMPSTDNPIDFTTLQAKYPDLYAWINISGTVVDYPVMQSATDNSYYLDYTIDGVKGYPGSIFSENYNSKDFTDYMNVLYGHNLLENGQMFTVLHEYMDMNFMKEHQYITIYQPGKTLIYQVFTALMYDNRDIMTSFDFTDTEGRQQFLDSIQSARQMDTPWRDDVSVSADDHLLALSTCIIDHPDNRRVVVATLTNPEVLNTGA